MTARTPRKTRRNASIRRLPKSIERSLALVLLVSCALMACDGKRGAGPAPEAGGGKPESRGYEGSARFDGDRALRQVVELVERGERQAGAARRGEAIAALEADLAAVADRVERQAFRIADRTSGEELELVNLIGRWRPAAQRRVLLATHWDTRRAADRDADPARRSLPVPGANDGTSGVAVLMELMRVLRGDADTLPGLGVDIALFDGEELVVEGDPPCCPGSRHFAENVASTYAGGAPVTAIVLDLVGDRELDLRREALSQRRARSLNDLVWRAGRRRAPEVFLDEIQPPVLDDHAALLAVGIPSVLLVDLDYDAWHTRADTPDRVSAQSLALVGTVLLDVLAAIAREEPGASAP